jgi:quercetin dioxygenase-like cupin family protein
MKITKLGKANKVPFNLDGRVMYTSEKVELVHLTLKPSEILVKHTNPFDVAIYVIEGTGIVETDENSTLVEPDMCIEIEKGKNRGIRNTGKSVLRVLVVKVFN